VGEGLQGPTLGPCSACLRPGIGASVCLFVPFGTDCLLTLRFGVCDILCGVRDILCGVRDIFRGVRDIFRGLWITRPFYMYFTILFWYTFWECSCALLFFVH